MTEVTVSPSGPGGQGLGGPQQQGGGPGQEDGRGLWGEGEPEHCPVHRGRRGGKQVRPTPGKAIVRWERVLIVGVLVPSG